MFVFLFLFASCRQEGKKGEEMKDGSFSHSKINQTKENKRISDFSKENNLAKKPQKHVLKIENDNRKPIGHQKPVVVKENIPKKQIKSEKSVQNTTEINSAKKAHRKINNFGKRKGQNLAIPALNKPKKSKPQLIRGIQKRDQLFQKNETKRESISEHSKSIDSNIKEAKEANKRFESKPAAEEKKDEKKQETEKTIKPKIVVHSITPDKLVVGGRTDVIILVSNSNPGLCYASFGNTIISGEVDNDGHARFHAPQHGEGKIKVKFSKDRIKWYGDLELEYYEDLHSNVTLLSIVVGLLLAVFIGVSIFLFIQGNLDDDIHQSQPFISTSDKRKKRGMNAPHRRNIAYHKSV